MTSLSIPIMPALNMNSRTARATFWTMLMAPYSTVKEAR